MTLYAGFENGNVVRTNSPNEIAILGGKLTAGNSRRVWTYDLLNQTVINNKHLSNKSILAKHTVLSNDQLLIVGESDEGEYFWEDYCFKYNSPVVKGTFDLPSDKLEKIKQYNFNQPNLIIFKNDSLIFDFRSRDYAQKSIIFGTDIEPFQIEVDGWTGSIDIMSIPSNLKLKNYSGTCRISQNRIFVAGGVSNDMKKVYKKAFIYDLNLRTVNSAGSMGSDRYSFATIFCNGFIYCLGGRSYGDDNKSIQNHCERFDINTYKWQELPPLQIKRCTSNAFTVQNKIFVAGGYIAHKKRTDTIEFLNEESFCWELFNFRLESPIEGSLSYVTDNLVYFFGGRSQEGNCKTKQVINLMELNGGVATRLGNELKHKAILNKMVAVRGYLFQFGSGRANQMDVVNSINMNNATEEEFKSLLM
jgi:hypothetical protein